MEKKRGRGRPRWSENEEVVKELLDELSKGKTLARVCRENPDFPNAANVYKLINSDENFRDKYVRAREIGYMVMADEVIDIADEALPENVQVKRLQWDTRRWLLSKTLPKIFGDRIAVDGNHSHTGQLDHKVNIDIDSMSKEERDALKQLARVMKK